jgi:hypothetical protein
LPEVAGVSRYLIFGTDQAGNVVRELRKTPDG